MRGAWRGACCSGGESPHPRRSIPAVAVAIVAFVGVCARRSCRAWGSGTPASSRWSARSWARPIPTGYPTYVLLAWLASIVLSPFGEPALPDEPPGRPVRRGGRRDHGRSRPGPDAVHGARRRGGARVGLHRGRVVHRHACGGTRAPPAARRRARAPARRLGGRASDRRDRRDRNGRHGPRRSIARRSGGRVRAGRRQSLVDAPPRPAGRAVRRGR